jgi:hypothetical protein
MHVLIACCVFDQINVFSCATMATTQWRKTTEVAGIGLPSDEQVVMASEQDRRKGHKRTNI